MRTKTTLTLYKKEIMDLLRDKKTILIMILMPVFLYPTMMVVSLLILQGVVKETQQREYKVAMVAETKQQRELADRVFDILSDEEDKFEYNFKKIDYVNTEKAKIDLEKKKVDLVVVASPAETELSDEPVFSLQFYNLSSNNWSSGAYNNAMDVIKAYSDRLRNDALKDIFGDSESIINPIQTKVESVSTSEQNTGTLIGMVLPFILIISILTGAIYPAIDATAGERERGTLETIMTLPVRKSEIMISKFFSVSTIAVFSAILNLSSMFFVFLYMVHTMSIQGTGFKDFDLHLFIPAILSLFICLPVFAMFASAVSLCVCIFAKSFKEANNISSPILIIFMFAAMASIIPTVELTKTTALIPVTNVALLIKSAFSLDYDYNLMAIVLLSNIIYCVLMVILMSSLFSSEDVLFGENVTGLHLFELRGNIKKGQIPGFGDLFLLFAGMMLLSIYSSSLFVLKFGLGGSAVAQLIFLILPLLYAFYIRTDIRELYSLYSPKLRELVGSVFIWIGAFLTEEVLLAVLSKLFPTMVDNSNSINETMMEAGFLPALLIVGVLPAIAEEAAFRGFMFGTLKQKTKLWIAIVVSAALFGLYHMNILQFFVGLYMGCIMAYMVYKSRSIFTSALFHFLNNSLSVVFTYYPGVLEKIPLLGKEAPTAFDRILTLLAGILLLGIGALIFGIFPLGKKKSDG